MNPGERKILSSPSIRSLKEKTRIIHALDVEDEERAVRVVQGVRDFVDAIKLSYPFIIRYGSNVVRRIVESTPHPIIFDLKVADIPEISSRIVNAAFDAGCNGLTIQGFVGRDTVSECLKTVNKRSGFAFVVVEMSNPGAVDFMQSVGEKIASVARDLGAHGIVAPATRPERVKVFRSIVGDDMWIMSPGIGAQGGKLGDAILAGADFEVIGRRIYDARDPSAAARGACLEIGAKLEKLSRT